MSQIDLSPAAWIALAPLTIACHGRTWRRAAGLGFVAGVVAGSALYGLLPYGAFLYLVICVYCGLNMALFGGVLAALSGPSPGWFRVVLPALLWTSLEYGRRYGFVSFPIMLGPTQVDLLPLWQVAAYTGGHGLSFLVALPAGLFFAWAVDRRPPWRAGLIVAASLGAAWALGTARMSSPLPPGPSVQVAGIQPALQNWLFRVAPVSRRHDREVVDPLMAKTRQALADGAKLIVWPETVIQTPTLGRRPLGLELQAMADDHGATIVVGGVRLGAEDQLHNSAIAFRPHKEPTWQDKIRLAGYSEGRLTPGIRRRALDTPSGRLGVMICLESVYPQDARALVEAGADLLVTTTDDAGFRRSPVAEFHVRRAALRSIETGRWGVHLSQAGPSALTDPRGRTLARTELWDPAMLRGEVRRTSQSTPYQRAGDVFSWAVLAVVGVALGRRAVWARRRDAQNNAA